MKRGVVGCRLRKSHHELRTGLEHLTRRACAARRSSSRSTRQTCVSAVDSQKADETSSCKPKEEPKHGGRERGTSGGARGGGARLKLVFEAGGGLCDLVDSLTERAARGELRLVPLKVEEVSLDWRSIDREVRNLGRGRKSEDPRETAWTTATILSDHGWMTRRLEKSRESTRYTARRCAAEYMKWEQQREHAQR